ncbi:hypothetical protein Droror1_Dr00019803 [Drosera rotundifolia]
MCRVALLLLTRPCERVCFVDEIYVAHHMKACVFVMLRACERLIGHLFGIGISLATLSHCANSSLQYSFYLFQLLPSAHETAFWSYGIEESHIFESSVKM